MPLDEMIDRYRRHNDAIARSQKGLSAPPGKKCKEEDCERAAFPWEDRCVPCQKKHRKALRAANARTSRPIMAVTPYMFEEHAAKSKGGSR